MPPTIHTKINMVIYTGPPPYNLVPESLSSLLPLPPSTYFRLPPPTPLRLLPFAPFRSYQPEILVRLSSLHLQGSLTLIFRV